MFDVHTVEFEHLTMQYWAASACCLGVLVLLCVVIQRSCENKQALNSDWLVKFSFTCIVLYIVLCGVSLGSISLTGECYCFKSYQPSFYICMEFKCLYAETLSTVYRLQHSFEVVVDAFSRIRSCKIDTTSSYYFSVLRFNWCVSRYSIMSFIYSFLLSMRYLCYVSLYLVCKN